MATAYPSVDSILTSQSNLIRRLEYGGPQGEGRAGTMTISIEVGSVMKSIVNLGFALNQNAMVDILNRGQELLWDIRAFTPTGPERDLPEGLAPESGMTARRTLSTPGDSFAQSAWQNEIMMALEALGHQDEGHGIMAMADRHDLEEAKHLIRSGTHGGPAQPDFTWGDEKGSLWNSIAVRPAMARKGGAADFEAYSTNYYSGFVNDGFDHGLMPILRFQKGDSLMKRKWRLYATLPVRQLGAGYPIWGAYHEMGGGDSEDTMTAGFSYFGNQLTPGAGVVDFANRTGMEKHEEGVHMFEKGFEVWLNRSLPKWRTELEKIVQRHFNEGKVWKGGNLRIKKGDVEGRGGRFAKRTFESG